MSPYTGSLLIAGGAMAAYGAAGFVQHWRRRRNWKRATGIVVALLPFGGKRPDLRVQYLPQGSETPQVVQLASSDALYRQGSNIALLYDPNAKNRAVRATYAWTVWLMIGGAALIALGVYAALDGRFGR